MQNGLPAMRAKRRSDHYQMILAVIMHDVTRFLDVR